MLTSIHPKLPMRDKSATRNYYVGLLGFREAGAGEYDDYLMVERDGLELHFFLFRELDTAANYGQVYIRTERIDALYKELRSAGAPVHPNGALQWKPWGQREFSILDPDNNLLTFGQSL